MANTYYLPTELCRSSSISDVSGFPHTLICVCETKEKRNGMLNSYNTFQLSSPHFKKAKYNKSQVTEGERTALSFM